MLCCTTEPASQLSELWTVCLFPQPKRLNEVLADWLLARYLINEVRCSRGQSSSWLHLVHVPRSRDAL